MQKECEALSLEIMSQTPIYLKSNVLYGIDSNIHNIKEKKYAFLVEGYMDVIQLVQNGIENCLAISGTSFTNSHAKIIKRFSTFFTL